MTQHLNFEQLTIEYHSGPIPPPFCHRYRIELKKHAKADWQITLDLEYFDREELDEEEIYDEGFTLNDDFDWEGPLPQVWIDELFVRLKKTTWKKKPSPHTDGSELVLRWKDGNQTELLQPAEQEIWQIFGQELIQAIFELGEKEAPLIIEFSDQADRSGSNHLALEMSFSTRHILVTSNDLKKPKMPWDEGQKLLRKIFSMDFLPESGIPSISGQEGVFIAPGDGLWYQLDNDQAASKKSGLLIAELKNLL